jgi:hypothetical protein
VFPGGVRFEPDPRFLIVPLDSPGVRVRLILLLLASTTVGLAIALTPAPAAEPPSLAAVEPAPAAPQAPERSVVGTLDQVDAAATQIVVATTTSRLAFSVEKSATIRQGSKTIKPADLPAHKGERVKIRYRENGGVRRAEWIVLASPPQKKK